jgi:hypothetical protein
VLIQHPSPLATTASKMDYYNTISGPSSRPYDPNGYSNPSGSSTSPSSQSPQFPSYPMMTDLEPYSGPTGSRPQEDDDVDVDNDNENDGSGGTGIEVDDSAPLVEPHQDLDSIRISRLIHYLLLG